MDGWMDRSMDRDNMHNLLFANERNIDIYVSESASNTILFFFLAG